MGGCGSKSSKTAEQYHVGLHSDVIRTLENSIQNDFVKMIGLSLEELKTLETNSESGKGIIKIQQDDNAILEYLFNNKDDGWGNNCLECCCCCGIFSRGYDVKEDGVKPNEEKDGCCLWLVPECCSCCSGLTSLVVLRGHHNPRKLSHRNVWSITFSDAKKQQNCNFDCPTCFGFCPIVGMTQGTICSPCNAKKMRMLALGFSEDEIKCSGWICCSSTDWTPSPTKGKYSCFQGYEDKTYIKPALWCKSSTEMCPEAMLNVEVCTFPGLSMSSSHYYFLDTRDLKPDPDFADKNKLIHFIDKLETMLGHVENQMPISDPHMHCSRRLLHSYSSCLKKAQSSVLIDQMKDHAEKRNKEFWPGMQGRHKENTLFKMAHRLINGKSYIVKVTKNFYEAGNPGMRNIKLVIEYDKACDQIPTQQTMV